MNSSSLYSGFGAKGPAVPPHYVAPLMGMEGAGYSVGSGRVRGAGWSDFTDAFKHGPGHFVQRALNEVANPESDLRKKIVPVVKEGLDLAQKYNVKGAKEAREAVNKTGLGVLGRGGLSILPKRKAAKTGGRHPRRASERAREVGALAKSLHITRAEAAKMLRGGSLYLDAWRRMHGGVLEGHGLHGGNVLGLGLHGGLLKSRG